MASFSAVAIAAILHIVFRISFFIEQNSDLCSTAPSLGSWIFLIAFLDVLLDICIYPVRYMHLPYFCQIVAETIVSILLTEFGSLVVWCTIENLCCKLCKSLLLLTGVTPTFYYKFENYILGAFTTSISCMMLLYVGQATDHFYFMHKKSLRMCRKINQSLSELWKKVKNMIEKRKCNAGSRGISKCEAPIEEQELDCEIFNEPKRNVNRQSRGRSRSHGRGRGRSRSRSRGRNYY